MGLAKPVTRFARPGSGLAMPVTGPLARYYGAAGFTIRKVQLRSGSGEPSFRSRTV